MMIHQFTQFGNKSNGMFHYFKFIFIWCLIQKYILNTEVYSFIFKDVSLLRVILACKGCYEIYIGSYVLSGSTNH